MFTENVTLIQNVYSNIKKGMHKEFYDSLKTVNVKKKL